MHNIYRWQHRIYKTQTKAPHFPRCDTRLDRVATLAQFWLHDRQSVMYRKRSRRSRDPRYPLHLPQVPTTRLEHPLQHQG